ncbi:MAG TPA: SMP-30/gluconolactonase/LRE family protein [Chloroflexia bacterium]|nr:SMP-30/gluconolactonase/LRE family protein [Chloroflexia bacterium]
MTAIYRPLMLLSALILALSVVTGASAAGPRPTSYILPGSQVFPEGVAYQQGTDYFYVSSNADGTIFRGNLKQAETQVFLPGGTDGRTTATGMKVDKEGRLYVSGASSGLVFVYDTRTGNLLFKASDGQTATFVNDVALTKAGDAYFTDSVSPFIYRVSSNGHNSFTFEKWLDLTGSPVVYQPGFNLNGIDATPDGKYLITVQSNTGKLFRINLHTRQVTEIDLGGATVTNGDGILLKGHTLYVMRNANALLVKIKLSGDYSSGKIISSTTDPSFAYPTTIAEAKGRLLVVNSQFNKRGPNLTPQLPFTVSSIKKP